MIKVTSAFRPKDHVAMHNRCHAIRHDPRSRTGPRLIKIDGAVFHLGRAFVNEIGIRVRELRDASCFENEFHCAGERDARAVSDHGISVVDRVALDSQGDHYLAGAVVNWGSHSCPLSPPRREARGQEQHR
jgi:hypothetical protein